MAENPSMDDIISLCKRRGFIFQSADVYGGLQGIYDYGPLGVELKNNLKAAWWRSMVYDRDDIEGIDTAIATHQKVLHYSGHEATFTDPMVDCRQCQHRMRADHVVDGRCDRCGSSDMTSARQFNLMLKTTLGPLDDGSGLAYLRPETAQGIFTNFKHVLDATSRKLPFGIAQIGKAFRNEVTPKNFIFRVREFEQMELEFFVEPGTDEAWHRTWIETRYAWWIAQGLSPDHLSLYEQQKADLSHYAKATTDILYQYPFGLQELEGIANRRDFDLGSHSKDQASLHIEASVLSNTDSTAVLAYNDPAQKRSVIPFVIEPSTGVDRGVLAILTESLHREVVASGDSRLVLSLKPHLAPVKVAVVPLAKNNEQIVATARSLCDQLRQLHLGRIKYEDVGNVGKAYRRHDEIGTPLCVTVDFDTIDEASRRVTVRYRDSMRQDSVPLTELVSFIDRYMQTAR